MNYKSALVAASLGVAVLLQATAAIAQTKVRVGWCTSVPTTGAVPFAVATKLGWFKQAGVDVELVNFPGSSDCVHNVATGEGLVAVPTVDPVAILGLTGVRTQVFYTAYRRNIFGLAVPADSPIKTYADLRGKKIGVTSMASAGVIVARSVAKSTSLDPDRDIRIVVSGQPAQTAVLLKRGDIDAVSQWDTQYALMELAGVPMRQLDDKSLSSFPANSFVATPDTIKTKSDLLSRMMRAYTMGVLYTIAKPRAASEMFHAVYPQVVPAGMDPVQALDQTTTMLSTVIAKWTLESTDIRWGESSLDTYQRYLDWLRDAGILKDKVDARDIATNELVDAINKDLDLKAVEAALAN